MSGANRTGRHRLTILRGTLVVAFVLAACSSGPTVGPAPRSTSTDADSVASSSTAGTNRASTTAATTTTGPAATSTSTRPTTSTTTTLDQLQGLELEAVATGLDQPVLLTSPPGDERLFVVERRGVIRILGEERPFLDIDALVNSEEGIEPGLLGLAFHPEYASNGRFFVFYYQSDAPRTRLAEYRVSENDPNRADPGSEIELMGFDKPTTRHNGGMLQFGPDGALWVSTGEGGAASTHAQDPSTRLSAILRLRIGAMPGEWEPAPDNPFADGGDGDPAVWAWGLRNPWRFWIDGVDGLLYIADVGHEDWEEIDVVPVDPPTGGYNFGWLRMEGTHCFQSGCDAAAEGLTLPVYEYSHSDGCSITGGAVYRGMSIPEMQGRYFFGDWCGGWVRSLVTDGETVSDVRTDFEGIGQINAFGVDAEGELYVLTYEGSVSKLVAIR